MELIIDSSTRKLYSLNKVQTVITFICTHHNNHLLHFTHVVCRFPDPIHCIDWNRQWVAITGHVQNTVIANKANNNSGCSNGGVIINRKLVCSMHFEVEDFQGIRLKPNALPSKNLFDNPSNNQQVQNWKNNQFFFFFSFSKILSFFFF